LRIVSWNIENLAPWLGQGSRDLAAQWRRLGEPAALCLQEVRIRASDVDAIAAMARLLPGFRGFHSLNRDARNGGFRGGRAYGVVTYLREDVQARKIVFPWDKEGRICALLLRSPAVALINVYAVNGTARPHFDHELDEFAGDRHAFKQRFIEDLQRELQEPPFAGKRLILVGDWNVSRAKIDATPRLRTEEPHATARRRFNDEFMPTLDVVDAYREQHPDARSYTWFNERARGRLDAARVDFVLASRALMPHVQSGIETEPDARPGSDHAPIWVETG
jgi:exodeoxyribonuclease III